MKFHTITTLLLANQLKALPGTDQKVIDAVFENMMKKLGKMTTKTLTTDNFHGQLKQVPLAYVMFYTPTCHYCQKLLPEFEYAARNLYRMNKNYTLGRVQCQSHPTICKEFEVEKFPDIRVFRYGESKGEFMGNMDRNGIVDEYKSLLKPAVIKTDSVKTTNLLAPFSQKVILFKNKNDDYYEKVEQVFGNIAEIARSDQKHNF